MFKRNLKTAAFFILSIIVLILSIFSIAIKTLKMYKEDGNSFLFFIFFLIIAYVLFQYYWKRWQSKKQLEILNNSPFIELSIKGFTIENNKLEKHLKILQGIIENYHVIIVFSNIGIRKSEIAYFIEFHPKSNDKILTNENLNTLISKYKKEKLVWKFHSLFYTSQVNNSEFKLLIKKIEENISILKFEKLLPISEKESDIIKPEIEKLIELNTWESKFV